MSGLNNFHVSFSKFFGTKFNECRNGQIFLDKDKGNFAFYKDKDNLLTLDNYLPMPKRRFSLILYTPNLLLKYNPETIRKFISNTMLRKHSLCFTWVLNFSQI